MTGQPEHVVVVGAGLGGLRTAQQLRSAGFQGRLSLVGAEPHVPYDRPPLSKQLLTGVWGTERVLLTEPAALDDLGVRTHLGLPAVGLHTDGVHTLRTLEDSLVLRDALASAGSLLVVGGGFIGAEVASAARSREIDVTVLEALP